MQNTFNEFKFAKRIDSIPRSFIREILKVSSQPNIISFAGGLPNPGLFPVEAIKRATIKVLDEDGSSAMQYSISQGYLPLRNYIAEWYKRKGLIVSADEIIITNGSQQALDLIGKVFIDPGDTVLLERPSYLGAIQAFSAYQPNFSSVALQSGGIDTIELKEKLNQDHAKLFYSIPNFQNPTGITYSESKRREVAALINNSNTIIVEDNPYGEINFTSEDLSPIKKYAPKRGILLGSFSKIISPGMRIGWLVADREIINKILVAKEASDLHSNQLCQRIIFQFLIDNDLEKHISTIKNHYKNQRDHMIHCIEKYFEATEELIIPQGGMFCWISLCKQIDTNQLIETAVKSGVLFVPGSVFYTDNAQRNTMRMNFTNSSLEQIDRGIKILGECITSYLEKKAFN